MNQLTNRPKANNTTATTKTSESPLLTGTIKMVDGVAVMLPPEEVFELPSDQEAQVVIERSQDIISASASEEVQYVYDADSAEKSKAFNDRVRQENDERAEKAKKELFPRKVGSSIVINVDDEMDDDASLFQQLENNEN